MLAAFLHDTAGHSLLLIYMIMANLAFGPRVPLSLIHRLRPVKALVFYLQVVRRRTI